MIANHGRCEGPITGAAICARTAAAVEKTTGVMIRGSEEVECTACALSGW